MRSIRLQESYRQGAFASSVAGVVVRLGGFSVNFAFAFFFGTTSGADVYFYCTGTALLFSAFFILLASAVIIPEAMHLDAGDNRRRGLKLLNSFLYLFCLLSAAGALVPALFPDTVLGALSRFDITTLRNHMDIVHLSLILLPLMVAAGYLGEILSSQRCFTLSVLGTLPVIIVTLTLTIFLHRHLGPASAVIGQCLGLLVQIFWYTHVLRNRLHWNFMLLGTIRNSRLARNLFFGFAGNLTGLLTAYLPLALLAGFGPGILSAMTYSQRTIDALYALLVVQIASVVGIKFNEGFASADRAGIKSAFLGSSKMIIFILVPTGLLISLFADEVISLLFHRGAFTDISARWSSEFLRYLAPALPFIGINAMVARLFIGSKKIAQGASYQIASNCLLSAALYYSVLSYGALAYAQVLLLFYGMQFLVSCIIVNYYFPFIRYEELFPFTVRVLALNCILAYALTTFLPAGHTILLMFLQTVLHVTAVVIINRITNISPEFNECIDLVLGKCRTH